jgi:hypothetical protein
MKGKNQGSKPIKGGGGGVPKGKLKRDEDEEEKGFFEKHQAEDNENKITALERNVSAIK